MIVALARSYMSLMPRPTASFFTTILIHDSKHVHELCTSVLVVSRQSAFQSVVSCIVYVWNCGLQMGKTLDAWNLRTLKIIDSFIPGFRLKTTKNSNVNVL